MASRRLDGLASSHKILPKISISGGSPVQTFSVNRKAKSFISVFKD
jgi:hypothetical protein